ncbi:MAG: putative molybdenum carrier protein [Candidatus Competibacteraceae bacterium]
MNAAFQRLKIIGGGQPGVDRAALDVGLALDLTVGSGYPRGRRAEDGRLPDRWRFGTGWTKTILLS